MPIHHCKTPDVVPGPTMYCLMVCPSQQGVICARASCPAHGVLDELPVGQAWMSLDEFASRSKLFSPSQGMVRISSALPSPFSFSQKNFGGGPFLVVGNRKFLKMSLFGRRAAFPLLSAQRRQPGEAALMASSLQLLFWYKSERRAYPIH